jgi:Predicted transcriptional regulators
MATTGTKKREPKRVNDKINSLDELKGKGYVILSDDDIVVPNRIAEVLEEKGLTPPDLVKMTGISRQSINAVMKGKMKPGVDFVLKVAYVLDKHVEELFFLTESAWVTTAKSSEESTLYVDVVDLRIVDGKTKKEIISKDGIEYHDTKTDTPITAEVYDKLLSEYVDDNLYITVSELEDELEDQSDLDENGKKKSLSERELEASAKKKLTSTFNERYVKRYRKLAKRINPLVNPSKKK